jgi:nitroreductase
VETLQAIRTLRVVRRFRDEPLSDDILRAILDAGRHAGSSKNEQRWAFIVVRKRETLQRLSKVGPFAGHLAAAAAAIALVTPRLGTGHPLSVMWDLGRAAQNMTLAAWELRVGSCPVTAYEPDLAKEILGYPDDRHCEYVLSLGWPADESDLTRPPKAGGRVKLDEIVHWERW